ncbi:putative transporter [Carnimonas sp. R-84981]|uniref:MFS transporter n=1 Tax=Carnimonas bestiolae TaxID=3402172 RepID=UPI003EDC8AA3
MSNIVQENAVSPVIVWFATIAAGTAMANNYILQPVLPAIATSLHLPLFYTGFIAASMQIGYMLGILFLVPLGDSINRKKLIIYQFYVLSLALLTASLTHHPLLLFSAGIVTGAMSTSAVQLNALGFHITPKGATVGLITMGISAGILLARLVGGSLADALGWRGMLAFVAAVMVSMAMLATRCLPDVKPVRKTGYLSVMAELPVLLRNARLIESAVTGGTWFFVFSLLWVTIMLHLQRPPLYLPAGTAGLFGLAGIVALILANYAGKLADHFGCRSVILAGMAIVLVGISVLFFLPTSLLGITLGIILFDLGCFAAQVANQTRVLGLYSDKRSVIYALYMFFYYAMGATGSFTGPWIYEKWGWQDTCLLSLVMVTIAMIITAMGYFSENNITHVSS